MSLDLEDRDDELSPLADVTEYGPDGKAFWHGTGHGKRPLRAWAIRRLHAACRIHAPDAPDTAHDRMVYWLFESGAAGKLTIHETPATFALGNPGFWKLDSKALAVALPKAFAWAMAVAGASQTLDEFLADPSKYASVAPPEPSGEKLLEHREEWKSRDRLFIQRTTISAHWPKACRTCGDSFRPERQRARNCPGCRKLSVTEQTKKRRAVRAVANPDGTNRVIHHG